MTEAEWDACTEPTPMLEFLRGKANDRKLRLFVVACCRKALAKSPYEELKDAAATAELVIDKAAKPADLEAAEDAVEWGVSEMSESLNLPAEALHLVLHTPTIAPDDVARAVGRVLDGWQMNVPDLDLPAESIIQCDWLRDIFGNRFHPVSLSPSTLAWNDGAVHKMAEVIYDDRAFDRLPILADALEDAGCDDADILGHCRGPGPHVRGCWVVDLLLGKG